MLLGSAEAVPGTNPSTAQRCLSPGSAAVLTSATLTLGAVGTLGMSLGTPRPPAHPCVCSEGLAAPGWQAAPIPWEFLAVPASLLLFHPGFCRLPQRVSLCAAALFHM